MAQGLVWESVSWRNGADSYQFDIERGGLFATLKAPGRELTLPMAVWDGLLDALKANRQTRSRTEGQQQFPARARARWYDGEIAEVADAFKSGRSIAEIAHAHNRSAFSIEHQLDKLGLISTAERHGPPASEARSIRPGAGEEANGGGVRRFPEAEGAGANGALALAIGGPPDMPDDRWEIRD